MRLSGLRAREKMTLAVTGAIVLRRNVRGKPIGCGLLGVLVAGEMACAEGVYTQFAPSVQGQMYPASTVSVSSKGP